MTDPVSLSDLLREGLAQAVYGDENVRVRGIQHDSRRVQPGDLFAAVPGDHCDGADFVPDAAGRGAAAALAPRFLDAPIPVVVADHIQKALARIAARIYGDPTASLPVIGITGTNGKTTITYLLEAVLKAAGANPAVIGTVNFRGPGGEQRASHTTPMADDLTRLARQFLEQGATHLVMEVSSHALAMHRADGMHFRLAAFTNLTQDHLDFHGDLESYARAKRRLFLELKPEAAVINVDDALGAQLAQGLAYPVWRCSRRAGADAEIRALSWSSGRGGIEARLSTPLGEKQLKSPLLGEHNLENLLVSLGCAAALRLDIDSALEALGRVAGAPGRLERIADPRQVLVAVDYAHTPDALDHALAALRPITDGRLWVVFGCGGNRDPGKRPLMGRVAAERADLVVLTSDNPRGEPPWNILDQIEAGVRQCDMPRIDEATLDSSKRGYLVQIDRRAAIGLAIRAASAGDTVLIAGKGHETVQIIGERRNPFDDRIEACDAIEAALKGRL